MSRLLWGICVQAVLWLLVAQPAFGGHQPRRALVQFSGKADGLPQVNAEADQLDVLKKRILAQHLALRRLFVNYKLWTKYHDKEVAQNEYWERAVGAAKRKRTVIVRYAPSLGIPTHDTDDFQSYYDGVSWNVYYRLPRLYQVSREFMDGGYTVKARGEYFLESLGWWPIDDSSLPLSIDSGPFFIRELLEKGTAKLLPGQEEIDSTMCRVLDFDEGRVQLWVDAKTGSILKRTVRGTLSKQTYLEYRLGKYQEVTPGLLLPFLVERVVYHETNGQWGNHTVFKVDKYLVNNEVEDSVFEFTPPPGTLMNDRDTDKVWQIPGGLDLLDSVCERASEHIKADGRPAQEAFQESTWTMKYIAVILGLLSFLLLRELYYIGRLLFCSARPGELKGNSVTIQ